MTETSLRWGNGIHAGTIGNYNHPDRPGGKGDNRRVRDVPVYKEGVGDHSSERMAKHEIQEHCERAQRHNGRRGLRGTTRSK